MSLSYVAPADATRWNMLAGSVAYHVSFAVLEHVGGIGIKVRLKERDHG